MRSYLTSASHLQSNRIVTVAVTPSLSYLILVLSELFSDTFIYFSQRISFPFVSDFRFPEVFGSVYGWSEGIIGLSYLGCGIGFFIGLLCVGTTNDRVVMYLIRRKGGVRKPEYRMSVMMFFTPLAAIGMF